MTASLSPNLPLLPLPQFGAVTVTLPQVTHSPGSPRALCPWLRGSCSRFFQKWALQQPHTWQVHSEFAEARARLSFTESFGFLWSFHSVELHHFQILMPALNQPLFSAKSAIACCQPHLRTQGHFPSRYHRALTRTRSCADPTT